ncbi:Kinase, NEK [Giardia lamblia P15]|uniref:non-specific serine/threonine protein kinase n=1 Tax=Giardia intestinalis (strain P15) TaxID=658858 RepID=E1EXW2_GIAIA|nr:Kinase, NEK [Giardia lamblia P15]
MVLLSHIYTDISTLSSTQAVVFFKANRRTDAAPVLIKLFRTQDNSDSSARIKTIVSFTELLTVTSVVLGTVSAIREVDSGFLIEYTLPPHTTIQALSEYLLLKRALAARESGQRASVSRSSSKLSNRSSSNYNPEHGMSTPSTSDFFEAENWCATPRFSRRTYRSKSNRSQNNVLTTTSTAATEWNTIAATIDRWQERIVWQILAQLVQGLSDFYKAPESLRAGLTPTICPEAIFVVHNSCASSSLELVVLACILDTHTPVSNTIYKAPEIFRGATGGPAADIWALGCLAFEVVTQRKPRLNSAKLVKDPVLQNIDCSSSLLAFITSCCRYNPHERPSLTELMKSKIIHAIMTHMFSTAQTKSELTPVKQLDLTKINMRRISKSKGFRPTCSEVPVSFANRSESSDSLSITDILDIRVRLPETAMYQLPLTYYDAEKRSDILGQQNVTWDYDNPCFSATMNECISRRNFLSFLLLPNAADLINREASNLLPFLTSFEAIKQLCDLSFDAIAMELDKEFSKQEEAQLLNNLDTIWTNFLNVPYIPNFLLQNDYFIDRIINELGACASWVIEKNNSIISIKTEVYCIYIVLSNLYFNTPQKFCACFLANNEYFNCILSAAFDPHISKLLSSILTEGHVPPFVITEAYQLFNCSVLQLISHLDSSDSVIPSGHIFLLINLSEVLASVVIRQARLTIDPSDLIPIVSAIKSLISRGVQFELLVQHLITQLLLTLSLFLVHELNANVYSSTSPAGAILTRLFSCVNKCFEELPKQEHAHHQYNSSHDTIHLIMILNLTCQIFMLPTYIQRQHLKSLGLDVCSDVFVQDNMLRNIPLSSNEMQQPSMSDFVLEYIGQTAYIGLGMPESWNQAKTSFTEAFLPLKRQFIHFGRELIPYFAQLTLNNALSSVTAVQFSLCRLRNILLDLESQSSLPLSRLLTESSFFSRIQHYLTLFAQKDDGKPLCATTFRREYPEVVYLLATAKRLLYLALGKRDSEIFKGYIKNNLQGQLQEYLKQCKQELLDNVTKSHVVNLNLVKTFIQMFI